MSTHPGLVRLIIEVIQYDDVVAKNNPLQETLVKDAMPARQVLDPHLEGEDKKLPLNPQSAFQGEEDADLQLKSRVRSIQRLKLPRGRNATWWLITIFNGFPGFCAILFSRKSMTQVSATSMFALPGCAYWDSPSDPITVHPAGGCISLREGSWLKFSGDGRLDWNSGIFSATASPSWLFMISDPSYPGFSLLLPRRLSTSLS